MNTSILFTRKLPEA